MVLEIRAVVVPQEQEINPQQRREGGRALRAPRQRGGRPARRSQRRHRHQHADRCGGVGAAVDKRSVFGMAPACQARCKAGDKG